MTQKPDPRVHSAPMGMLVGGSEIAGFAVVGLAIDYALGTLNTFPWATMILAPLGLVVAMWHLSHMLRPPAKP